MSDKIQQIIQILKAVQSLYRYQRSMIQYQKRIIPNYEKIRYNTSPKNQTELYPLQSTIFGIDVLTDLDSLILKVTAVGLQLKEKDKIIQNLKSGGQRFPAFLKGKGISDETIQTLNHQGIDSLQILRQCQQQILIAVGIKVSEAIKLKKL